VFGENRHQAEDQRQFAIIGMGKIEADGVGIDDFGFFDLGVIGAVVRPAVIAKELPREDDVLGGDRNAVGKMRGGIKREGDEGPGIVGLDALRHQAVERERLVVPARHQAFDDIAADRLHGEALHDQRVEAVERAEHAFDHASAFRRLGVGVRHNGKIARHGGRAVHGDSGRGLGRAKWHRAADQAAQRKPARRSRAPQQLESAKAG